MEEIRGNKAALVDLLDRILDKGLVPNTDAIISVSGNSLTGLNLRAAIADIATILNYGMWDDWDEAQWISANKEHQQKLLDLCFLEELYEENILLETFGSYWHHDGIYNAWRSGNVVITEKGLKMYRKEPYEILYSAEYEDVDGIAIESCENSGGPDTRCYSFFLKGGNVEKIRTSDQSCDLGKTFRNEMERAGFICKVFQSLKDTLSDIELSKNETILCRYPMWHLSEDSNASMTSGGIWNPGLIYVTSERLIWYYLFDENNRRATELNRISGITTNMDKISNLIKAKELLSVICQDGTCLRFSGTPGQVPQVAELLLDLLPEACNLDKALVKPEMTFNAR